ncbi:MAG: hypothetical protein ACI9U2_002150 [Bradymonadia bacterium]|jgi:hypothetical protein
MKSLLLTALAFSACSGDLDDPSVLPSSIPLPAPAEAEQYGLIVLSQTIGEEAVSVSGQLLDYAGVDRDDALAALATPDDAWLVAPAPPAQTCRRMNIAAEPMGDDARIDLLDAGLLRISAPGEPVLLIVPTALPPVVTAIAGVVYDGEAVELTGSDPWRISTAGAETGPIAGEVEPPDAALLNSVGLEDEGLVITTSAPATVVLSRVDGVRTQGLVCGVGETPLHLDWATLAHLGEGVADIAALTVRRAPLLIDGADAGDLLFVVRDADELFIPLEF